MTIGIYVIENLYNHKKYVGQSWNIKQRLYKHSCAYGDTELYRSIRKHGWTSFIITQIEISDEYFIGLNNEQIQLLLDEWEQQYIVGLNTLYPTGYNLRTGGTSNGLLTHKTKQKISKTLKNKHQQKLIVPYERTEDWCHIRSNLLKRGYQDGSINRPDPNKISKTLLKKYKTKELVVWNVGIPMTKEAKQKSSCTKKQCAYPAWNKGIKTGPQSEITKKKRSNTCFLKYKEGYVNPNKGKTWTKNLITGKREYEKK